MELIPNFKGVMEYNPHSNPIAGVDEDTRNAFAYAYMAMWWDDENWTDFNIAYSSGDEEMAAHMLVESGAIDSANCFESCREIEQLIEAWARNFKRLTPSELRQRYDEAFDGCTVYRCAECGHVSYVNDGNEEIYAEQLETCWSCESPNVEKSNWE